MAIQVSYEAELGLSIWLGVGHVPELNASVSGCTKNSNSSLIESISCVGTVYNGHAVDPFPVELLVFTQHERHLLSG